MKRIRKIALSSRGVYEPVVSEEDILKEIVVRLWFEKKIPVWRINCPVGGKVRPNTPGIPDLIGFVPRKNTHAQPLFIEVKRPGGRRRPEQEQFIADAKADGCCAFFAESWDDVLKEFSSFYGL